MTAQCRHLTARISREALEERIAEKLGRRLTEPLRFDLEVASDSDFGRGWHQLLAHICHLSASAPTLLACADIRWQYSRTLIEMLVHSAPHNYASALEETLTQPIPWHVRRARDYVHSHIADIRSVADIAASIGITTRNSTRLPTSSSNITRNSPSSSSASRGRHSVAPARTWS
jgi:hypothetical protein